jgi:hypothetical protein
VDVWCCEPRIRRHHRHGRRSGWFGRGISPPSAEESQDDEGVGDGETNGDMEWQEEGETSEGALGQNRARRSSKLPCQMLMSHPISSNNDTDTNYNKNND